MQMRNMIWPWRRKSRRRMARIVVDGPITGATRKRVLKALREVKQREFPALLLRIDSPGGTVGDSQEIHAALLRLREQGCRVVAGLGCVGGAFRRRQGARARPRRRPAAGALRRSRHLRCRAGLSGRPPEARLPGRLRPIYWRSRC